MMRKWSHTILFPLKVLFCLAFLLFTYNMFIYKTRCNDQKQSSAGCTFPIPLSRDIFSQLIFNTQQCFWCWCCLFVNCFPADFKVTWLVYFWCWCCDSSWSEVLSALRQLKAWISKKNTKLQNIVETAQLAATSLKSMFGIWLKIIMTLNLERYFQMVGIIGKIPIRHISLIHS